MIGGRRGKVGGVMGVGVDGVFPLFVLGLLA